MKNRTFLNVLSVLSVLYMLNMLNVLDMLKDASLACRTLFYILLDITLISLALFLDASCL